MQIALMYIKGVMMTDEFVDKFADLRPDNYLNARSMELLSSVFSITHDALYDFHVGDRVDDLRLVSISHYGRDLKDKRSLLRTYLSQDYADDHSLFIRGFNGHWVKNYVFSGVINGYRVTFLLEHGYKIYLRRVQRALDDYHQLIIPVRRHDNAMFELKYDIDLPPYNAVIDKYDPDEPHTVTEHATR